MVLDPQPSRNGGPSPKNGVWTISSSIPSLENAFQLEGVSQETLTKIGEDDVNENFKERYGWGNFRPDCLQFLRTPKWLLFWLSCAAAVQGMVINGVINVVITTLEKRFSLSSTESGLIASFYDVGSFISLLPVTFFGDKGSKPRWLGLGMLVLALGSTIFALPQFTSDSYVPDKEIETICKLNSNAPGCKKKDGTLSNYIFMFIGAQLLHGAGAAPLFTLGVSYIDETVEKGLSALYVGIYSAVAIIGPAVGFLVTGQFLNIYVDALSVDYTQLRLSPDSSVWVGAWWIGFILAAVLSVLFVMPILGYPKQFPGYETRKSERVESAKKTSQNADDNTAAVTGGLGNTKMKELPKALKKLVTNPTFMFLCFGGACEGLLLNGFAAFLPKIIESQFNVNSSWAAMLVGIVIVPAGGGGTFFGGYLIKKLKLKCAGILKFIFFFIVISLGLTSVLFIKCPNVGFAGVNKPYLNSSENSLQPFCTSSCNCTMQMYDPICGTDNVMYYSACHAGCKKQDPFEDTKVFSDCSCIDDTKKREVTISGKTIFTLARRDRCTSDCFLLPAFLSVAFGFMLATFIANLMLLSATLRCIDDDLRSLGLGVQWQIGRLLGTIPAPVFFGFVIDQTCVLWEESCGVEGACRVYDNNLLSWYMAGVGMLVKAVSSLCFFIAWRKYSTPEGQRVQRAIPT